MKLRALVRIRTKLAGLTFEKSFTLTVNDLEEESNSANIFAEYGQASINQS